MEKDGYFVWPTRIDDAVLDQYVEALKTTPFRERATGVDVAGYDPATATQHDSNAVDVASDVALLEAKVFQPLFVDPTLLSAVQGYLGVCPVHTAMISWWTIGADNDEKALSRAALLYHQDKDWVKWLKAFVYLTDVDEDNGPHVFVEGSHKDYQQLFFEKYGSWPKFSQRFSDEEIKEIFGAERIKPLLGKRGTLIVEDTSGLHKGSPVLRDHRLIVEAEWACSPFMAPTPCLDERALTPELLAMREKEPRFFRHYDHAARERHLADQASAKPAKSRIGKLMSSVKKRLPF